MNAVDPQAHIFVVWQSGFAHLSQILWELSLEFEIKFAQHLEWEKEEVPQMLTRMYPNRDFDHNSPKMKEIGGNQLVFIFVVDKSPEIKGEVNQRALRHKRRHRSTSQGHSVFLGRVKNVNYLHASDLETEAFFNFQALTGGSREAFDEIKSRESVIYLPEQTASGLSLKELPVPQFDRAQDVFHVLNEHTRYAVLRNWEGWPEAWTSMEHEDIDVLTNDYYKTLLLLGARPVFPQNYRVHHLVEVGDGAIPFDVRFVGDGYYDQKWQQDLLNRRVEQDGFYRLSDEDYFWTLLYHGVFHKRGLSPEYKSRLTGMLFQEPRRSTLMQYLKGHHYRVSVPKDRSVKFHKDGFDRAFFWSKAFFRALKNMLVSQTEDLSYLSEQPSLSSRTAELKRTKRIKYGVYAVGRDLIIKTTDSQRTFLLKHEERFLREVASESFFPDVIDAFDHGGQRYLVLERKPGRSLASVYALSTKQQQGLKGDLDRVLAALKRHRIQHRDIRPSNILLTKDGAVSLVDFQFALKDGEEISTSNSIEAYILQGAEKNLGGPWYKKQAPDQDAAAARFIVEQYSKRRSLIKYIRSTLRRFTFG